MKNLIPTAILLSVFLFGCAKLSTTLSEDADDFEFRKTRWGYPQERVELAEQGNTIYYRDKDTLVYKSKVAGVPALLVYTFKDNRLRAAGYMTYKPVTNDKSFKEMSIENLGNPSINDRNGMVWQSPDTVVYANTYNTYTSVSSSKYRYSDGGVLAHILSDQLRLTRSTTTRWSGVWAYIDKQFYNQLHEVDLPLSDLTKYEKMLFGIIKKSSVREYGQDSGETISIPERPSLQ